MHDKDSKIICINSFFCFISMCDMERNIAHLKQNICNHPIFKNNKYCKIPNTLTTSIKWCAFYRNHNFVCLGNLFEFLQQWAQLKNGFIFCSVSINHLLENNVFYLPNSDFFRRVNVHSAIYRQL